MMQPKIKNIIEEISKETGLSMQVIETVVRSQFAKARIETANEKNIRFPYLGMLYHRENKNPEYIKHRKKLNE